MDIDDPFKFIYCDTYEGDDAQVANDLARKIGLRVMQGLANVWVNPYTPETLGFRIYNIDRHRRRITLEWTEEKP